MLGHVLGDNRRRIFSGEGTLVIRTIKSTGICFRIVLAANIIPNTRCGVRFPLRLPLTVRYGGKELLAESQNISSAGVLLRLNEPIPAGSTIQFTISMPGRVLRLTKDILVNCTGRVVRCCSVGDRHDLAAIIDDYHFVR